MDLGILCLEFGICLVDAATAGSREENDGLTFETIGLDKRIDDGRSGIPPNRETDVNQIITVSILQVLHDSGARIAVLHFHTAARGLYGPVQILRSIFDFWCDFVERSAGDGGKVLRLAFGANCFNMAFILPYVGYAIYSMIVKRFGSEKASVHYIAAAVGSYIGINVAAFAAAVEFGLQPLLFKDSLGNALYCPYDLSVSIPAMMIPHLAVAGFVEAIFTVVVFAFVRKTAPDLLFENIKTGAAEAKSHIPVFALIAVLVAATPLGLLATGTAWGEWGSDEIADVVTNGSALGYTPSGLENGWSLDVIMPDYAMEGMNEVVAYILSAIIGVALLVIIFKLASLLVKEKKVSNVA